MLQVLLLDEPTNHMDLESVEWLERYLIEQTSNLALVIVSHDREFLDRVCTKIVETEQVRYTTSISSDPHVVSLPCAPAHCLCSLVLVAQGVAYTYNGNYRTFLDQKGERVALQMKAWEAQQKEIKALKNEINSLRPLGESAAGAIRNKERDLEAMQQGGKDHVARPFVDKKKFQFRFPPCPRVSQEVTIPSTPHTHTGPTLTTTCVCTRLTACVCTRAHRLPHALLACCR